MRAFATPLVKAACLSVALMGATAVVTTLVMPDIAYAKSDKAKDKSKDKSKGKAEKAKGKKPASKKSASDAGGKKPYQGGNKIAVALGVHPSELGNLNSWNSNENAEDSEGMPGRLASFEEFVLWSEAMGGAQADIDAALAAFGEPTCEIVDEVTDCYYDPSDVFGDVIPGEGEEGYEDYLLMVAANDALEFTATSGGDYDAFGEEAEMEALQDIANKDISDDLFASIREWILMTAEEEAAGDGTDAGEGGDD